MYKDTPRNSEKILGRQLPFSQEAERAVLGALLLNDERLNEVIGILMSEDFYVPSHRFIYHAMTQLAQEQKRVDIITLQDRLDKAGVLVPVGGMTYLVALQEDIPAVGLLEHHAHLVKEKSVLRELIHAATGIITNCYAQNEKGIETVIDDAERTIFSLSARRSTQSFVQLNMWIKRTFKTLTDIKSSAKGITGIPSGYRGLDELIAGFQNSDLVVLAARPSMGKTALALTLANHAARAGYVVGFFSLEMSAEQLTVRLLAGEARISQYDIRNATINSDQWISITNVAAHLAERKIFIDDTALQSIMDIRAKARRLKQEHGLQFIVIDYLQLIHSYGKHENRHQEISEVSRSLKALAKELDVPILALSQLSRAVDSRVEKRPLLSDLRESGAIEQDADLIMFIYRDIVYNQHAENPALAELIIGKHRNGPTGTVYLNFRRELTLFEDYEHPDLSL